MSADPYLAALNEILEHLRAETEKDYDALLDSMTEDCFNFVAADPTSPYVGPQEVEARYRKLFGAFPDLRIELRQLFSLDPEAKLAVSENFMSGTHAGDLFGIPATGEAIELRAVVVWEFGEGYKIRGESIYYDLATLLRQIGHLNLPGSEDK